MNDNKSTISGKVKRYAKVSSKITSVTAHVVGRKIIGNNDINKNADIILNALGGLKSIFKKGYKYQKTGIILSGLLDSKKTHNLFSSPKENRIKIKQCLG